MMRNFETGATRDSDDGKADYEGFFSPLVVARYGQYMTKHQVQRDGKIRDSDNWQKGMPLSVYIKSAWRHFLDWWMAHRGYAGLNEGIQEALCALMFNVMGYLHVLLLHDVDAAGSGGLKFDPLGDEVALLQQEIDEYTEEVPDIYPMSQGCAPPRPRTARERGLGNRPETNTEPYDPREGGKPGI